VRITELEEDNKRLRMQIAQKQLAPRPSPRDAALHESNAQLKAELQLMRNRVATLTGLLQVTKLTTRDFFLLTDTHDGSRRRQPERNN
jgi:hypothetical protein